MERLQAGTQYGDWTGTAAADGTDVNKLREALETEGLVPAGQFLVGFNMRRSETTGAMNLEAYFVEGDSYDEASRKLPASGPVAITTVEVPLTLDEFLSCFKRFNVTMVRAGLGLEGREFPDE